MNSIVDFIISWKDLITKVFGDHTIAASLVTIVAIGAFFVLEQQIRKGKRPTNLMIVFVGWAILVPIIGLIMTILGKIWAFLEAVFPKIADALGSFYKIYERHPLLVLVLVVLGTIAYFLWRKFRSTLLPNRTLRIIVLTIAVVLVAHVASPIVDWVAPAAAPAPTKDVKSRQSQQPGPAPTGPPASQAKRPMPSPSSPASQSVSGAQPASAPTVDPPASDPSQPSK